MRSCIGGYWQHIERHPRQVCGPSQRDAPGIRREEEMRDLFRLTMCLAQCVDPGCEIGRIEEALLLRQESQLHGAEIHTRL